MRVVTVYVGQGARTNLGVGLESGVWGFKATQNDYDSIRPGDLVLLGTGFSLGSPRVGLPAWREGHIDQLHVARVESGIHADRTPVWPDEFTGENSYPHRFELSALGFIEGLPLGDTGPLPEDVADGLRRSAIAQGRAYVLDLPEHVETALLSQMTPLEGNRPMPPPMAGEPGGEEPLAASPRDLLDAFRAELDRAGLSFPDHIVTRFVCGLLAKPFAILAGLSGSGKTQIASALGRWLGPERTLIAAVRPDWTGSEALFGYENLLISPASDGRAAWSVPPVLEFLLRAADHPDEPHLLVLDEMNLAHVERYFADALSGMESGAPVIPNLVSEDGVWRTPVGGPERLPWPTNLFIVGTVNVDETTYQFSPKVLDRSTTIEFRTETASLVGQPPALDEIVEASKRMRRGLVDRFTDLPDRVSEGLEKQILDLHRDLAEHGREFGHRTYQEMRRYATIASAAAGLGDPELFDHLVLQKVLPRIHGSSRELSAVLDTLGDHVIDAESEEPKLPLSADKLQRMRTELNATHFTAF